MCNMLYTKFVEFYKMFYPQFFFYYNLGIE